MNDYSNCEWQTLWLANMRPSLGYRWGPVWVLGVMHLIEYSVSIETTLENITSTGMWSQTQVFIFHTGGLQVRFNCIFECDFVL